MIPSERSLEEPAESVLSLARRAVEEYTPLVEAIIMTRSAGIPDIERTLDGLLDFCFDSRALLLFRKLCRYYYAIDPSATSEYIRAYREMWDSEREVPRRARGQADLRNGKGTSA
jgi:hypothetical protein